MLPPYPTLPSLVSQFISLKCLGETQYQLPFEPTDNPIVGSSVAIDIPNTTAFLAKYSQDTVSDGFYHIKAYVAAGLELPSACIIKVLHWSLDIDSDLSMTILKASVVSTLLSTNVSDPCKVANNFQVKSLLHKMQYSLIQRDMPPVAEPPAALDPASSLVEQPAAAGAEIGFGQKSRSKAVAFTKERRVVAPKPPTDDLMEAIQPVEQGYTEEDIFRAMHEEEGIQMNTITLDSDEEFEFDVFPEWALKYLRLCYNM